MTIKKKQKPKTKEWQNGYRQGWKDAMKMVHDAMDEYDIGSEHHRNHIR